MWTGVAETGAMSGGGGMHLCACPSQENRWLGPQKAALGQSPVLLRRNIYTI